MRRIRIAALSRVSPLLALLVLAACGSPPAAQDGGHGPPLPVARSGPNDVEAARANAPGCKDAAGAGASPREKGIDAFLADRPAEALELLDAAVRADPRDRAAESFRQATIAKMAETKKRAGADVSSITPVALEPLPLARTKRRDVAAPQAPKLHLDKESEKKNLITDDADWEAKNQLASPHVDTRRVENIPTMLEGERVRSVLKHADHVAAIYTSRILVSAEGKRPIVFDARAPMRGGPRPFEITFAQMAGKTLLVELAYNGYAKDSGGKNGYFAAYDAETGALAWSTDPLVANTREVVVSGSSIVTGYGFTAEPDFLFVLDLASGNVEQKLPLKSGPSAIRQKGDRLHVRAYDVDYVFKSTTPFAAPPPAVLAGEGDSGAPPLDADARCWVRRATTALAARDRAALHQSIEALSQRSGDRVLFVLLRREEERLAQDGRLDLTLAPLVAVPAPPWDAAPAAGGAKGAPAPKLVKTSSRAASATRNMHPAFSPDRPFFIAPVERGKLPEGARADIPSSYGLEDLRGIIPNGERTLLVYGGRYLAVTRGGTAERVFDLEPFRHPPKANAQWKEFAVQDVTHAIEKDGVLYVCNGGGSYAKEVFGKKGFVSAIEGATGKLLWRSAPLTCNATMGLAGDYLVTGYGFTAEPDFVFLLRRADGVVVHKLPIESGPDTIVVEGRRVHVETYGHVVELELR